MLCVAVAAPALVQDLHHANVLWQQRRHQTARNLAHAEEGFDPQRTTRSPNTAVTNITGPAKKRIQFPCTLDEQLAYQTEWLTQSHHRVAPRHPRRRSLPSTSGGERTRRMAAYTRAPVNTQIKSTLKSAPRYCTQAAGHDGDGDSDG